jgi:hypothetical protein
MTERYIDVLDPRGVPQQGVYNLARRPTSLQGATLGILSNSKPNGDLLLQAIQSALAERFQINEVIYRHKGISSPSSDDVMADLAKCHVVLNAVGD